MKAYGGQRVLHRRRLPEHRSEPCHHRFTGGARSRSTGSATSPARTAPPPTQTASGTAPRTCSPVRRQTPTSRPGQLLEGHASGPARRRSRAATQAETEDRKQRYRGLGWEGKVCVAGGLPHKTLEELRADLPPGKSTTVTLTPTVKKTVKANKLVLKVTATSGGLDGLTLKLPSTGSGSPAQE